MTEDISLSILYSNISYLVLHFSSVLSLIYYLCIRIPGRASALPEARCLRLPRQRQPCETLRRWGLLEIFKVELELETKSKKDPLPELNRAAEVLGRLSGNPIGCLRVSCCEHSTRVGGPGLLKCPKIVKRPRSWITKIKFPQRQVCLVERGLLHVSPGTSNYWEKMVRAFIPVARLRQETTCQTHSSYCWKSVADLLLHSSKL